MAEGGERTESNHEDKRPIFGQRYLRDPDKVFQHNAWDHVKWDPAQLKEAEDIVRMNSTDKLAQDQQDQLKDNASINWDTFYNQHQNRFFKDRHWLFTEFPELLGNQDRPTTILEVGCGAGNTVFPILQTSRNVFIHCCDFSSNAIDLVKANPLYNSAHCSAFVYDIGSDNDLPISPNSIDYIVLIFVLSALPHERFQVALRKLYQCLKPSGKILFRDYGRLDLAQLRFKPGQCLADNQYVRGDGTLVYFFTPEEVAELMDGVGLIKEQLLTDQRLQVNRGKQLKMYRVWIQAKYFKPVIN